METPLELPVPLKQTPYKHQAEAFYKILPLQRAALLMEQGTGKTLPTIALAAYRCIHREVRRLLIVCPKSVMDVWVEEFKNLELYYNLVVLRGKVTGRQETLLKWENTPGLQIAVINYEGTWRVGTPLFKWRPDMIVLDESHKIKKGGNKQSRFLHSLGNQAKYRLILTGTPVTQSPLDFWSQYKFLDPTIFGKSFTRFRDHYAVMRKFKVLRYKNLNELSAKAHRIAYRTTRAEALDLPPVIEQNVYCKLEGKAKDMYQKMKKESLVKITEYLEEEDGNVTAPFIVTQILRLHQMTGGFVHTDEGEVRKIHQVKLDALRDVLEGLPENKKVVIFARFTAEIQAIKELVSKQRSVRTLSGKTEDRGKLIKKFQEKTDPNVLVVQVQTGGLGITLHAADTVIFYSMTFSYSDYEQAKARLVRIGQTADKVNCIHLVCKNTVDETIVTSLREKKDMAELVVDILKERREGRMAKVHKKKPKKTERRVPVTSGEEEKYFESKLEKLQKEMEDAEKQATKTKTKKPPVETEVEEEAPKKKKKRKKQEDPGETGIVTLKALAGELNISPVLLRKKLRDSDLEKPDSRWEWKADAEDLDIIRDWFKENEKPKPKKKKKSKKPDPPPVVEEPIEEDEEEIEEDEFEELEEVPYEEMGVKELRELCKERGIKTKKNAKKAEMVEVLMEYDNDDDDDE